MLKPLDTPSQKELTLKSISPKIRIAERIEGRLARVKAGVKNLQRASGRPAGAANSGEFEFYRKVWADCVNRTGGECGASPCPH
jgi:hypothetical protein